jgi:hypothetical protein
MALAAARELCVQSSTLHNLVPASSQSQFLSSPQQHQQQFVNCRPRSVKKRSAGENGRVRAVATRDPPRTSSVSGGQGELLSNGSATSTSTTNGSTRPRSMVSKLQPYLAHSMHEKELCRKSRRTFWKHRRLQ